MKKKTVETIMCGLKITLLLYDLRMLTSVGFKNAYNHKTIPNNRIALYKNSKGYTK